MSYESVALTCAQCRTMPRRANGRRPVRGFGLIELMVAMVLGLLVLGAAIAVFQSNQRTFNANEGQNRIQENARAAYEMMSRDIRAAGGTACPKTARPDEEHALTADETSLLTTPVTGTGSTLTVLSGDDASYQITAATTTTVVVQPESTTGWKLSDAFKVGDKMVLCNATLLYVVTLSGVTDATNTLAFSATPTPAPVYDPDIAPVASVTGARFRTATWYLSGGSLYVNRNGVAEAVIPGVTALNVTYLPRNGTSYTATPPSLFDVIAVRIALTLRGQKTLGGDVKVDGNNYITRNTSSVTAIRSRAP